MAVYLDNCLTGCKWHICHQHIAIAKSGHKPPLIAAIQTPAISIDNQPVPLLIETSIAPDTRRMKITLAIKGSGISTLSPKGPWIKY